ncbi:MAG: PspC domain-containing protein [Nanoarchaeota archaeon]|nr:PspC domain-containing protein [Nanoarchaeota archaeon]
MKRLYRAPAKDSIIGGVCAGIANYFGIDPVIVRLIWVLAIFGFGFGIFAYLLAWIIIPRK